MATVKVVDLLAKVQTLLQDATGVRWPLTELQGWLNDAYRDTLILRPDANTLVGEFVCVAGARQNITSTFAGADRLVNVLRNTAAASRKSAVALGSRQSLDSMLRDWYAQTPSINVELYMFDPRTPKEFFVYPPATTTARLEVMYAQVPTPHALSQSELSSSSTAETIRIADTFATPLMDYIMYRAYSKNTESASNAAKAGAYYQSFQAGLGVKGQSEAASQPGVA